jgi:hypothetical protein
MATARMMMRMGPGLLATWANGTLMARGPVSSADEGWFQRGLSGRSDCSATLFACGAGDGNRTRTVSLGTNLI